MSDLGFIDNIDWNAPDAIENGKRLFNVRCKMPFSAMTPEKFTLADRKPAARNSDSEERVFEDDGDGVTLPDESTGDLGSDDEVAFDELMVAGVASSTSVDFYGTEMSLRALKQMAAQFITKGGVPYLPRHSNGLAGGIEWDEVIGRTIYAEVAPIEGDQIAKPHNPSETHFLLRVTTQLYSDEPMAQALVRRLQRGEPIGQSIGGWFTQLQIVQNEEGDVERIIVLGVELDHLAVTRAPANPDSDGLHSLRSTIAQRAADHRAVGLSKHIEAGVKFVVSRSVADALTRYIDRSEGMDSRHIVSVAETDGTVVFQYLKSGVESGDVADDELVGERVGDEPEADEPVAEAAERAEDETEDEDESADQSADLAAESAPETRDAADLDSTTHTAQDEVESVTTDGDAQRSADSTPVNPAADTQQHEEPAMSDTLTLDAIRDLFQAEVAPLKARLDAVEDARQITIEASPEPDTSEADARVEAAEARALQAERSLANMVASGGAYRMGRSAVSPSIPNGPAAESSYMGLIERTRADAPVLAAVAERSVGKVAGSDKASSNDLEAILRSVLMGAEQDGLITPPTQRADWR